MNNTRTILLTLLAVVTLSGCSSLQGKFENVPVCAVGETKAYVISMYGPVGIGSELTKASAAVICHSTTKEK